MVLRLASRLQRDPQRRHCLNAGATPPIIPDLPRPHTCSRAVRRNRDPIQGGIRTRTPTRSLARRNRWNPDARWCCSGAGPLRPPSRRPRWRAVQPSATRPGPPRTTARAQHDCRRGRALGPLLPGRSRTPGKQLPRHAFSTCVTDVAKLATGESHSASAYPATRTNKACARRQEKLLQAVCLRAQERLLEDTAKSERRVGTATTAPASLAVGLPQTPGVRTATRTSSTACTLPDGSDVSWYHCYTPQDIRSAYGVDAVPALSPGVSNEGQGQTIVLVDSYGSPTAAADLQALPRRLLPEPAQPRLPADLPARQPAVPQRLARRAAANPGPCAAAGWSGEATLDIEWAYSIAPRGAPHPARRPAGGDRGGAGSAQPVQGDLG